MICRIHTLAHEYGTVFPTGVAKFRAGLALWLTSETHGLSGMALETFHDLVAQLDDKETRLHVYDRRLAEVARANEKAKRLLAVSGIGILTATAMVASVADANDFKTGRDL